MDLLETLEIYIPVEAEVKSILLWSLPNSVLRRMGLPQPDADGSRKLAESPEGIWICPAVIRRKGQKQASHAGNSVIENMSALMGRECRATPGPFRMSFVSSNRAAHRVLKDTMPGAKVSSHKPNMSILTPGSAPRTCQDAVVIYQGRIFLSIRNPKRSQGQQERHKPQSAPSSSVPSTSEASSNSHKRQSPQASVEPANKELQRKKLCITRPKISPKPPEGPLTRTDSHSNRDQELPDDDGTKEKHTACKVSHSETRKDVAHKVRDVSSFKTARSDSVHKENSNCHKDARGEQAAEEAAGLELSWWPQSEQEEMATNDSEIQDLSGEEAKSTNQNNDMEYNIKTDGGEADKIVGSFEHSRNPSWTRTDGQGAVFASTSLQQEADFKDLAQEDKIAQLKAKIRQREAAFNNLQSS